MKVLVKACGGKKVVGLDLFHNVTAFAGFTADGKNKRGSIAKRITAEIEKVKNFR